MTGLGGASSLTDTCPSCGRWFDSGCDAIPNHGAVRPNAFGATEVVCATCAKMLRRFYPPPDLAAMAAAQMSMSKVKVWL